MNFVQRSFQGCQPYWVSDEYPIPICFEQFEPPMEKYWGGIRKGDVVVDVGACYGQYTLPAIAMGAHVIAYEPAPRGVEVLTANLLRNGWGDRCIVRRLALGNGAPYPKELMDEVWVKHYPADRDTMRFATLDEDLDRAIPVRWMKCDNEGGELLFLQGAARTLETWKPALIIEDHDNVDPTSQVSMWPASVESSKRIHAMLSSMGYSIEVMPWNGSKWIVAIHPDWVGGRPSSFSAPSSI